MSKITIVGLGYVGMSMAIIFSKKNDVTVIDTDQKKLQLISKNKPAINDSDILQYYNSNKLDIFATNNKCEAYKDAEYIIIAVPTNYDEVENFFDTTILEQVINDILDTNSKATIIIKSTVPVGFTRRIKKYFNYEKIIFSPEFLREGHALYDNLYPSRIIIGDKSSEAQKFGLMLNQSAKKKDIPILFMTSDEAEAVKLFTNSYLALRVAYFNELDSYCLVNGLKSKSIIDGISLDKRIGDYYNNPSFGYGGYCLPKDTKQLLSNFHNIPQDIISAIVKSNKTRINFLAEEIIKLSPSRIGVHRLIMKSGSDNFRFSAIKSLIDAILKKKRIGFIIFEPMLETTIYENYKVYKDIASFKKDSDLILANRNHSELDDVQEKLFTRDIYSRD